MFRERGLVKETHEECVADDPRRTPLANGGGEESTKALRSADLGVSKVRGAHRPSVTTEVELYIHRRAAG